MKKTNILEDELKPRVRLPIEIREKIFIQRLTYSLFRAGKSRSRLHWSDSIIHPKKGFGLVAAKSEKALLSELRELASARKSSRIRLLIRRGLDSLPKNIDPDDLNGE